MNNSVGLFAVLKFRYLLTALIILAVILLGFGYFTIKAAQKATLTSLSQQGKALTTVLIASASNIIETDRQMTDIAVDELVADVNSSIAESKTSNGSDSEFLEILAAELGLIRVYIFDKDKQATFKMENEPRGISDELDSLQAAFVSKVKIDQPFDIIFDFFNVQDRRMLFGILPFRAGNFVYLVYPWEVGQYSDKKLSLSYLLNQLSIQAGIEYIVLQNYNGIVFASKQVSQMDKIEGEPFLSNAIKVDSALSRTLKYQDREVLEIVQKFDSGNEFSGLFRVGMSLFGYRQLTANFQKQVWLLLAFLLILSMAVFALIGGYQNLKVAQDTLGRARAISQSLHDSIAGIVISTDENLLIVTANSQSRRIFGLPGGVPLNWRYDQFFTEDIFRVKAVLADGRPRSFETNVSGKESVMRLLVSTNPILGGDGKLTGVMVVAHDISERVALERQAEQSRRLTELGSLAAGLAHDIRNPLNAIGLVIQRMRGEIQVESNKSEFNEFIGTLDSEQKKLNQLVEKILQVARSSRFEVENMDIKPVIEEAISLYNYEASSQRINLKTYIESGLIAVNKSLFQSIVANLLKNAIEAIGHDGQIEIAANFVHDSSGNATKLILTVTDTGLGISENQMANLFKPFYTTKPGGTGLGLASAYKAAVDHGGEIKVESKPGGPTKFIMIIPVKR